jgi:hypothetical protein
MQSTVECLECDLQPHRFDLFLDLFLPFPETSKSMSRVSDMSFQRHTRLCASVVTLKGFCVYAGQMQSTVDCLECALESYYFHPFLSLYLVSPKDVKERLF